MTYQRLLSIKPDYIPGLMCYAELLRNRGKLKMAMRCYREIIKIDPKMPTPTCSWFRPT